jgi:hypothetical protein|tara:strand:+ start:371 stop:1150 length:780 start_codon:yes stop_codon:yes gene_type:complete
MTNRKIITSTILCATIFLTGCGGEEEVVDTKPVVKAQPKGPKAPPKKTLSDIATEVNADPRIIWTDEENSESNLERESIFRFFTAFLHNEHALLRPMLSSADQLELGTLADATNLTDTLNNVTRVDIRTGSDLASGKSCVVAVYEVGMNYQPQLWSFEESNGSVVFTSLDSPPGLMDQLSGDWVKSYFKRRAELLAKVGDDDQSSSYQLAGEGTTSSSGGGTPNIPGSPGGPGGPGGPGKPGGPTKKPGPPKMPGTSTK